MVRMVKPEDRGQRTEDRGRKTEYPLLCPLSSVVCPLFSGSLMSVPRIGIVTVSDRASQGVYEDRGGPAIRDCLTDILACPWEPVARIIPDEQPVIETTLRELCDTEHCCLVVTTGGPGPARRDVTPEATAAVCDKLL